MKQQVPPKRRNKLIIPPTAQKTKIKKTPTTKASELIILYA